MPLPPAPRDPALDEPARRGLQIIEAGLPDHVSAAEHLETVAGLPAGLQYGVGFEDDTPGIDERLREVGRRGSGSFVDALLAADPALDGIGWAAAGPWAVVVLRAKPLEPLDGPAVQRAVEVGLRNVRPTLRPDHALASLAAEVVADGVTGFLPAKDDEAGFVAAVDGLLASPELRRRMGQAALARFDQQLNARVVGDRLVDRLVALSSGRPGRSGSRQ